MAWSQLALTTIPAFASSLLGSLSVVFAGLSGAFAARAGLAWGFGPGGCWICVLGGGVRLLGLVREGMSVVVCSDFSLLVRLVGWTCRATLTHAWSGAPDLVNKVKPKLR